MGDKFFTSPKPINLIKDFVEIGTSESDIILDFFAGSGTTGDAVMQLNAEDGGNRKFILVQIPEEIDPKKSKVAYDFVKSLTPTLSNGEGERPTIFEITKERLIRATKKINENLAEKNKSIDLKINKLQGEIQTEETKVMIKDLQTEITKNLALRTQNYFKVFETMPIWEDYDLDAAEFDEQIKLFSESKMTEDDLKTLLTTWKTFDGISLTQEMTTIDLGEYECYYGNKKLYLMHKGFTTDHLVMLLEKIDSDKKFEPRSIITFGYYFDSKSIVKMTNCGFE